MNCRQLTLAQLSRLVGQPTIHNGASCHVIEVLAEGRPWCYKTMAAILRFRTTASANPIVVYRAPILYRCWKARS